MFLIRIVDVNAGLLSEDLHQYVVYDSKPIGLQRTKLDDPPQNSYLPPSSLSVHLNKIPMPELNLRPTAPKQHPYPKPPPPSRGFSTPSVPPPLLQAAGACNVYTP